MKACEAIVPATSRPPKSDHSFLRHIVPICQKRDELTWERVAGWTNRHGTVGTRDQRSSWRDERLGQEIRGVAGGITGWDKRSAIEEAREATVR